MSGLSGQAHIGRLPQTNHRAEAVAVLVPVPGALEAKRRCEEHPLVRGGPTSMETVFREIPVQCGANQSWSNIPRQFDLKSEF
jgi:hypothetical protein